MPRKGYAVTSIHANIGELVEALATKYRRKKSWIIEEAIRYYIEHHEGGKVPVTEPAPQTP